MGGLLAARALIGPYERVTILDRDTLPAGSGDRKGVPQGRHVHVLLARGVKLLEAMFPGLQAELEAEGVPVVRDWAGLLFAFGNHRFALPDGPIPDPAYFASRPKLEQRVRARVQALAGIEILDCTEVSGLLSTPHAHRVTGVRIHRDGAAAELGADLVVDATGRTGRASVWLAALGYPPAREEELPVDLVYATRQIRTTGDAVGGTTGALIGHHPGKPRALGFACAEAGRAFVTVAGYGAHHPPTDDAGFDAFLAGVAPPALASALSAAEALGPVVTHRYPSNLRRHYQELKRFPDGFLVFGDALCSFNPLYGQGMTVAALQAQALRKCFARAGAGQGDLAARFFSAAAEPIDLAWQFAVGADLALPEIAGPRNARTRLVNRWIARVQAAAETEPVVSEAFLRVINFLDPPTRLFAPGILRRVLHPAAAAPGLAQSSGAQPDSAALSGAARN
jgi:2-polyprenyl-6-methoxyphenol hydroxylase-like FAD-dependent oxidoreductase